ncbi:MAG TPA: DUF397 domain-containing protein [Streptosporangiaceae bacterium]|jgi:Domain of unknown function (DUF397)|nr:DUF397 domain-containing protein [Streptosporangiaceae bacterium]
MGDMPPTGDKSSKSGFSRSWYKSSYSMSNGHCVEVVMEDGVVGVRDSKVQNGPVLRINPDAWVALLTEVRKIW